MGPAPFLIGLVLLASGSVWLAAAFAGTEKAGGAALLDHAGSLSVESGLAGAGTGFYTVLMPDYAGGGVFVQVLDPGGNVVSEEGVRTRMAVGYFVHDAGGTYTARITNVSGAPLQVEAVLGETGSGGMAPAGALVLAGSVTLIAASYAGLSRYIMAQPDENIP